MEGRSVCGVWLEKKLKCSTEEPKKVVRLSPKRRRTIEEFHPAKIYVNHELKGKPTSPSQVSSAFLC